MLTSTELKETLDKFDDLSNKEKESRGTTATIVKLRMNREAELDKIVQFARDYLATVEKAEKEVERSWDNVGVNRNYNFFGY